MRKRINTEKDTQTPPLLKQKNININIIIIIYLPIKLSLNVFFFIISIVFQEIRKSNLRSLWELEYESHFLKFIPLWWNNVNKKNDKRTNKIKYV